MADPAPMDDGSVGAGTLEVDLTAEGKVILSAMGRDGDYRWYCLPPAAALALAEQLETQARAALGGDRGHI